MKNDDLKDCPFCGGRPQVITENDTYMIRCDECGARILAHVSFYYSAAEKAQAAWNRRAGQYLLFSCKEGAGGLEQAGGSGDVVRGGQAG